MNRTFKTADYDRTVRLGGCLPSGHLACFVVDSVAQFDLSVMYTHYGPRGGEPYAPEVLLSLLLYGYATGVFSSRKAEDLAMIAKHKAAVLTLLPTTSVLSFLLLSTSLVMVRTPLLHLLRLSAI